MKKNTLLLLISMTMVSHGVMAATSGSMNFSTKLLEGSCEIADADLNATMIFPDLQISGGVIQDLPQTQPHTFHITGCPSSVTKAGVKFDYTRQPGTSGFVIPVQNTGDGGGAAFFLETPTGALIPPGGNILGDVANNSADVTVNVVLKTMTQGQPVKAGSIVSTTNVTLVME